MAMVAYVIPEDVWMAHYLQEQVTPALDIVQNAMNVKLLHHGRAFIYLLSYDISQVHLVKFIPLVRQFKDMDSNLNRCN